VLKQSQKVNNVSMYMYMGTYIGALFIFLRMYFRNLTTPLANSTKIWPECFCSKRFLADDANDIGYVPGVIAIFDSMYVFSQYFSLKNNVM
jgi:hypothetical protein